MKIIFLSLLIFVIFSSAASAQKKAVVRKPSNYGVVKTIKGGGKDLIKIVKLNPATKSATVDGIILDWQKDGTVYFSIDLKKGQRLLITSNSDDISIETYQSFEPLDTSNSGSYELEALTNANYSIVARSNEIGKKYTLTLELK